MSSMIRDIGKAQVAEAPPLSQSQKLDVAPASSEQNNDIPGQRSNALANHVSNLADSGASNKKGGSVIIVALLGLSLIHI